MPAVHTISRKKTNCKVQSSVSKTYNLELNSFFSDVCRCAVGRASLWVTTVPEFAFLQARGADRRLGMSLHVNSSPAVFTVLQCIHLKVGRRSFYQVTCSLAHKPVIKPLNTITEASLREEHIINGTRRPSPVCPVPLPHLYSTSLLSSVGVVVGGGDGDVRGTGGELVPETRKRSQRCSVARKLMSWRWKGKGQR